MAGLKAKWLEYKEAESWRFTGKFGQPVTWKDILREMIIRPDVKVKNGKAPMTHLHPDHDKLHIPHGVYIADWRKYRVEDHPALVNFQKTLQARGLHDPWLRNNAWACYPNRMKNLSSITVATTYLGRGLVLGFVIYVCKRLCPKPKLEHTPWYREKYGDKEVFAHH